jgi:hypothetical protein
MGEGYSKVTWGDIHLSFLHNFWGIVTEENGLVSVRD